MRLQPLLFIPIATALLYACEDHQEVPATYADVLLAGKVTDETLVSLAGALDQAPPADVPARAPTLDEPANGAALPRAPIPVFRWHVGSMAGRMGPAAGARWAGLNLVPRAQPDSIVSPFVELFGPIRSAHAHGEPYTGTATYLVFSVDSSPKLLRVFTSETSFTPTQADWDKMANASKPITLTLVGAIFEQNRIVQDGGPFAGSSTTFTVMP